MGVTEICSFKLVLEGKTGKEIPESSRLEFLEKFWANNFALSDAEDNTFNKLSTYCELSLWSVLYVFWVTNEVKLSVILKFLLISQHFLVYTFKWSNCSFSRVQFIPHNITA